MLDISELKFDEKGLIPAIVVDGKSGQVLTLALWHGGRVLIQWVKSGRSAKPVAKQTKQEAKA